MQGNVSEMSTRISHKECTVQYRYIVHCTVCIQYLCQGRLAFTQCHTNTVANICKTNFKSLVVWFGTPHIGKVLIFQPGAKFN